MTEKTVRPKGKHYSSGGMCFEECRAQFYSDGAQYLDPLHENASVQF